MNIIESGKRVFTLWMMLCVCCFIVSGCGNKKGKTGASSEKRAIQKATVTILDVKGTTTRLTNFYNKLVSHSSQSKVYSDVPTVVVTPIDTIGCSRIGPDRPFSVALPFEIIKEVSFETKPSDQWRINSYLLGTFTLGNGQLIKGGTFGIIEGESGIGKTDFRLEYDGYKDKGIRKFTFEHTAKSAYNKGTWGKKTIVLHKLDGTTLNLNDAAFIKAVLNKNGCWLDDEPAYTLDFQTNGRMVAVPWDKIQSISPTDMNSKYVREEHTTLTAKDGSVTKGRCPPYAYINDTIRGTLAVAGNYKLWVNIEVSPGGKPVYEKIEFK